MLQGVDTSSGLFDLDRHKLAGFFCLCKLQHIRQDICQRFYGPIQITRCKCKSIRINVIRIGGSCLRLEYRNVYTHDILLSDFQIYLLLRSHQCRVQSRFVHAGFGYDKIPIGRTDTCFYLFPKLHVHFYQIQELTHQFVSLIFQKFVTFYGCDQFFLGPGQFHTGRGYLG